MRPNAMVAGGSRPRCANGAGQQLQRPGLSPFLGAVRLVPVGQYEPAN
jgi:hypothetical protein